MSQPPRTRHLLILEDDVDLRVQWRQQAEHSGFLCYEADTVEGAEEVLRHSRVDAAIVDIFLASSGESSATGGIVFVHHLRNPSAANLPSWTTSLPVITVTGSSPVIDALSYARSIGADLTLRKPIAPSRLIATVQQLIANRPDS